MFWNAYYGNTFVYFLNCDSSAGAICYKGHAFELEEMRYLFILWMSNFPSFYSMIFYSFDIKVKSWINLK